MQAIEGTATIDDQGQLVLDQPLGLTQHRRVRVIVLVEEEDKKKDESDADDTPDVVIVEALRQGLHEALTDPTTPLSQMWDGIDAH